jgi:peptidoglycan/LPS O-acetylase OafA/YrhL
VTKGLSSNLDLLRAIAVLLVLAQHLFYKLPAGWLPWIAGRSPGLFGVLLFFVHTSLVLMFSMQRSGLRGAPLLKNFYTRRIFRVYPLALVAVISVLALRLNSDVNGVPGLSHDPTTPTARTIVAHVLLIQNIAEVKSNPNVLWSLPFEVQMYVVLPSLFLWVSGRPRFRPLAAVWCLSVLAGWAQPQIPGPLQPYGIQLFSILIYVPCFLSGVIAFTLLPRRPVLKSWMWPAFILSLLFIYSARPGLPVAWLLCLVLGLMIPMFEEIKSNWLRIASHEIAKYSYGIYLTHPFCLWFALVVLAAAAPWMKAVVMIASLVILPVIAYHCIEKPLIIMGQRLASRWTEDPKLKAVAA